MRLNGITMKQIRFRNGESKNINDGGRTNERKKNHLELFLVENSVRTMFEFVEN